ncbi:MAG: PQQ-binding-like beta-propeller repeat protein [Pirellulales bacterium]
MSILVSPQARRVWSFHFVVACSVVLAFGAALADDWPQWRGPKRDGVWRETEIVERFNSPELQIKWRAPLGSGYSGPTVANGRVYVMDRVTEPVQLERVHCFDESTGEKIWSREYDALYRNVGYPAGPRASVTIDSGKAYSLGTMGRLFCFDAARGSVLWKKDLVTAYDVDMPGWGIACSPLVERDLLIVVAAGENACLVAFDKNTGEERWKALDDPAQYSSPIVIDQAGKRVLVCWTGDNVVGLNPRTGEVYWKQAMKRVQMPIGAATPVTDGKRLFVSSFYDGSLMLRLTGGDRPAAEQIWRARGLNERQTKALHCMISTPVLDGDYLYGVDSYGQLRCLDANTGERIWESQQAVPKERWSNIHLVRHGEKYVMFNERGELIFARLSPQGYEEISRAKLIEPTSVQLPERGGVCWSHPAYANKHVFARNDEELVCASLAVE